MKNSENFLRSPTFVTFTKSTCCQKFERKLKFYSPDSITIASLFFFTRYFQKIWYIYPTYKRGFIDLFDFELNKQRSLCEVTYTYTGLHNSFIFNLRFTMSLLQTNFVNYPFANVKFLGCKPC